MQPYGKSSKNPLSHLQSERLGNNGSTRQTPWPQLRQPGAQGSASENRQLSFTRGTTESIINCFIFIQRSMTWTYKQLLLMSLNTQDHQSVCKLSKIIKKKPLLVVFMLRLDVINPSPYILLTHKLHVQKQSDIKRLKKCYLIYLTYVGKFKVFAF